MSIFKGNQMFGRNTLQNNFYNIYTNTDVPTWRFKLIVVILHDIYFKPWFWKRNLALFWHVLDSRETVTIYRHLQRFWGASGNFWQNLWDSVYDLFGRNDLAVGVFGTILFTNAVILGANAILLILDTTGKPSFLLKYKIQEDKNVPVDREKLKRCIKVVLFNGFVVTFFVTLLFFYLMKWRGCPMSGEMPTFQWVILELTVYSLVEEVGFYYSHRLMHHKNLYKHIYKMHHEWTAPIGIMSLYAHPVEHCIGNLLPIIAGPVIMGSHLATAWMWFFLALVSTTISHCGYHFPFLPSPEAHDYHHQKFTNCFGVLGVLDRLHGTDDNFRASKAYQRHITSLSLTPLSQQYPDNTPETKGK